MEHELLKMAVQLATTFIGQPNKIDSEQLSSLVENLHRTLVARSVEERRLLGQLNSSPSGAGDHSRTGDLAFGDGLRADLLVVGAGQEMNPRSVSFDAEAWLASLPEPTRWAEAEARRNNPNVGKGWVGVSDTHIVCLLDGKPCRLLTAHLKRNYKHLAHVATPEAYRAHFRLPPDYPMGSAEYQARKSKGILDANKIRLTEGRRSPVIQKKIDKALARSGVDISGQISPETRPGLFEHEIVCLECSARVQDLKTHLRDAHKMSLLKYIAINKISSRYPPSVPPR